MKWPKEIKTVVGASLHSGSESDAGTPRRAEKTDDATSLIEYHVSKEFAYIMLHPMRRR
jgi:hypothetical protein